MVDESITQGWRALDLFTDRDSYSRLFLSYLNDDPPRSTILFLHGDGGNGKSLLMARFREHLCKRFEPANWGYLRSLPDSDCIEHAIHAENGTAVPFGRLDFYQDARDGFSALTKLRRDLGGANLRFHLFDFAIVTYLHKTHQLTDERIRSIFPGDEIDLVLGLAGLVQDVPFGSLAMSVLNMMDAKLGGWFHRYRHRRKLDTSQVEAVMRMDAESELIQQLPGLFAADINASMQLDDAPERVALFFDTYEAIWGHERNLVGDQYFGRDEWVRRLLAGLELDAGVVVVICGRDVPRWPEAPRFAIGTERIDLHLVGDLSDRDAETYLLLAGIDDAALRNQLREDARVAPGQIHPFSLGLGADLVHVLNANTSTPSADEAILTAPHAEDRRRQLVDRFLRYVDANTRDTVLAVSVCRSFDRKIYRYLGDELDFETSRTGFRSLTEFSFIQQSATGDDRRFRVHDLLRRMLDGQDDELQQDAHEAMECRYRQAMEAGDRLAIIDAIFHSNRLNESRGIDEWLEAMVAATRENDISRGRALLVLITDLRVGDAFRTARMAFEEAEFHALIAEFDLARTDYNRAIAGFRQILASNPDDVAAATELGVSHCMLGILEANQGQRMDAEANYQTALGILLAVRIYNPLHVRAGIHIGTIHDCMGHLKQDHGETDEASMQYRLAVGALSSILQTDADNQLARQQLGKTEHHIGILYSGLSNHVAAERHFREAIVNFEYIISHDADHIEALIALGDAKHRIGGLNAGYGDLNSAEQHYQSAITVYEAVLAIAPGHLAAQNDLGIVQMSIGSLLSDRGDHTGARQHFYRAIAAFERTLAIAPDHIEARLLLGKTQDNVGRLLTERGDHAAAEQHYHHAVSAFESVLALAPDHLDARNTLGIAQGNIGILLTNQGDYRAAEQSYRQALATYETIIELAPTHLLSHINLGAIQVEIGRNLSRQGNFTSAELQLRQAITTYEDALALAPDSLTCRLHLGECHDSIGQIQARRGNPQAAEEHFQLAVTSQEKVLALAPEHLNGRLGLGATHANWGRLLIERGNHIAAFNHFDQAIKILDSVVIQEPSQLYANETLGRVHREVFYWHLVREDLAAAEEPLHLAIESVESVLAIAPDRLNALIQLGTYRGHLGRLLHVKGQMDAAQQQLHLAIASFDSALDIAPSTLDAHEGIADSHSAIGSLLTDIGNSTLGAEHYRQAIAIYQAIIGDVPDRTEARANLGTSLYHLADIYVGNDEIVESTALLQEATTQFGKVLMEAPHHPDSGFYMGCSLLQLGIQAYDRHQFEVSIPQLEKALSLLEQVPETASRFVAARQRVSQAWVFLTANLIQMGDLERAVSACSQGNIGVDWFLQHAPGNRLASDVKERLENYEAALGQRSG